MHAHVQTQSLMGAPAQLSIITTPCQRERRPKGLNQYSVVPKGTLAQRSSTTQCQRERRLRSLPQHNAKGNTGPVVFYHTMPKGTPTQWSLQHNAKWNLSRVVFYNTMSKGTPAQWSFATKCHRDHQPSGLLSCLQHRGLALTDLSVGVTLETCSIIIVSYAFHTYSCSCYILKSIYLYFHVHAFNT
jgi:hypothetical protein